MYRFPFPHSMIIVCWWSYNPITEAIGILDSVPLMCLIRYIILPVFSSFPLYSTAPSLLLPSPLPYPLTPPLAPSYPLGLSPPVPTIFEQPRPPASAPSSHRGPESATLQCTAQPCSASLIYNPLSPQIPPPTFMPPALGITIPPPPVSLGVSLPSTLRPRFGSFPGPVPCGVSAPTVEFMFCVCRNLHGLVKTEMCINSLISSLLDR